ncbi:MAG: hypothetical protein ACE5HX_03945 [bacterium]
MKSISILGLGEQLNKRINEQARRKGLRLNKTIKSLLEEALGLKTAKLKDRRNDFIEFMGVWTNEDVQEFEIAVKDFEQVDSEGWK